ncbi:MAG: hypothetical protein QOJ37_636, partial [Pseudonocardiales bacterium]|nr:hypothetical protein [Pseudonocardiales bacterium]
GIGALCWLPSISRWAAVVAGLLAPGGRLFLREGHPVLWALAQPDGSRRVALEHPYFERSKPTLWDEPGSYVATDHVFVHTKSVEWNHGLGEIVSALLANGLRIAMLEEHDSVPWDALPGMMQRADNGEYQLMDRPWRMPHTYTLQAVAPDA